MKELRETIWRLSNLDRGPLIDALLGMDAEQQAIACGSGRRAELGSSARNRAEKARSNCFRLGKIIYFLRFRSPATNTSPEDAALCRKLAHKLLAKGQWTGGHSI